MTRFSFAAALFLMLAACATPERKDLVWIGVSGDRGCMVEVEGKRFPLPAGEARLQSLLARLARSAQGAVLGGESAPPGLRCWAAAMFVVQHAGFARLGFISPPEEEQPVAD